MSHAHGGGRGRAALVADAVEFDERDAALLRAIDRSGSVAAAAAELERSRARSLSRLETLEAAFGPLVERQRGGDQGGGSRLTEHGAGLLDRFDRLTVALEATAEVPATVLHGTVDTVNGELATVDAPIGPIRGLHDGLGPGDRVQVRLGADTLTIQDVTTDVPADTTSARNRCHGELCRIDGGDTVLVAVIDVDGTRLKALVTAESAARLDLAPGERIRVTWKATATRLVADGADGDGG